AAIERGLLEVDWPARMQRLTRGPLPEGLPAGWELWLDGGHNESAGEALAAIARDWQREDRRAGLAPKPLHLIFGMLNTKQPVDFLRHLAPLADSLQAVAIGGGHQNLTTDEMLAAARAAGVRNPEAAPDIAAAVARIRARETQPARILSCGSLYFAGEVLA